MVGAIDRLPDSMQRLFNGLGIAPGEVRRSGLEAQVATMAEVCRTCVDARRCRQALDETGGATVPDFCPNAGRFALADGYLHRWCIAE